jgi:hypothetical protein
MVGDRLTARFLPEFQAEMDNAAGEFKGAFARQLPSLLPFLLSF